MSSIPTSDSLLSRRPYGGTAIFISRHLKSTIEVALSECDRICAIHVKFNSFSMLLVSCYMPCDTPANADMFWGHCKS